MVDEKKCPYCAEMIKAEAIKCRFCNSDLRDPPVQPSSASEGAIQPSVAACTSCNVVLVQVEKRRSVSVGGVLSAIIFLFGMIALVYDVTTGVVIVILGFIVSAVGSGKRTFMVCPKCGREGATL